MNQTTTTAAQPLDLDKLQSICDAAKGWQWESIQGDQFGHLNEDGCFYDIGTVDADQYSVAEDGHNETVLNFIAAFDPTTVAALIAQAHAAQPAGAADTTASASEWQLFADHFGIEPEAIDYSHPKWEGFIAGLEVARASLPVQAGEAVDAPDQFTMRIMGKLDEYGMAVKDDNADWRSRVRSEIFNAVYDRASLAPVSAPVDHSNKLASYPLEDMGYDKAPDSKGLFRANDWQLTVGDVRAARRVPVSAQPVGYVREDNKNGVWVELEESAIDKLPEGAPVYAAPVSAQPVDLERFAKDIRHHILHQAYTWLPAKHAKTLENMVGGLNLKVIVDAYAVPVSAQQGAAEQHNAVECDSALRAEPASQQCASCRGRNPHCTNCDGMGIEPRKIDHYAACKCILSHYCDGKCNPVFADELATRCRAEGGDTSNNESSDLAAKAPAAQAVPVGVIVAADPVHGWHMRALKPWDEIGAGALLYAAPTAGAATTSEDARDAALRSGENALTLLAEKVRAEGLGYAFADELVHADAARSAMRATQQEGGNG
jgi:hypothetical protein